MAYNVLKEFKAYLTETVHSWLKVITLDLLQAATIEGLRFGHTFDTTLEATGGADTKYFLYVNPVGSNVTVALQERRFKALNGEAEMQILWDVESYVAGTLEETFNQRNTKGPGIFQISEIAAPVLGANFKIREPDFVSGAGGGINSSGDISSDTGFRLYGPGTYFIFKVVNLHNLPNRILIAYDWLEIPPTMVKL
jgi:hypothetical protein